MITGLEALLNITDYTFNPYFFFFLYIENSVNSDVVQVGFPGIV